MTKEYMIHLRLAFLSRYRVLRDIAKSAAEEMHMKIIYIHKI